MSRMRHLAVVAALLLAAGCSHAPTTSTQSSLATPAPDFTLTDSTGAAWNLAAQRGKTLALFFGYTHCGDTCPATAAKLAQALRQAHASAKDAEIVFVTIDPQRDHPRQLARFLQRFPGAPMVGLTGSQAQIDGVLRDYHIYARKSAAEHAGNGYDFMHTAAFYIIDRNGRERAVHNDDERVAEIAANVRSVMR
ncbi:MAG: SCO family protein [bacterium]|nr:SCO family protein [bacterium]